eukprot:scaffold75_cov239-Chaetoceros_neogracile.AAC.2
MRQKLRLHHLHRSAQVHLVGLLQNTASISTDISNETGDEVSVSDVRVIEFPSTSPSLSPAPTLSQQPTLSIKPSYEFFPSSIPTQSSFPTSSPTQNSRPTSTPTKTEERTFNIVSSFNFDDSIRQWCLQAKNVRRRFKYLLGVGNGNPKKYELVRLFKEGSSFSNDSVRLWSLQSILDTPVPSSAPSISFAPTKSSKSSKGKSSKSSKGKSPKGQGKGKGKQTKTGSPTKSSKTSKDVEDGRKPDVPNDFVAATVSSSTSLHPILASIIALVGMIFVL